MFETLRALRMLECFKRWLYVDTLHVVGAFEHSCKKLQCLVKLLGETADLRAHRALDDTVALRHVIPPIYAMGIRLSDLAG